MLPDSLARAVVDFLSETVSPTLGIKSYSPASGGCINNGGKLETTHGNFFIKWNDSRRYPGMFDAEAKGLNILAAPGTIHVPRVFVTRDTDEFQFIMMEYIEPRRPATAYWEEFGCRLALLHLTSSNDFGLDHNNYVGSLTQANTPSEDWINFFIELRLKAQLDLALGSGRIHSSLGNQFRKLFMRLPELLNTEKPSLLHGDLWSGNLITDENGLPCLIDPAVYFGNREVDLAMTQLFGGFSSTFIASYHDTFPLAPGFSERVDLYNLYPLLVHVNLFGGGYAAQVQSIVKRFVS